MESSEPTTGPRIASAVSLITRGGVAWAKKSLPLGMEALRELEICQKLQGHPNIVKLAGHETSPHSLLSLLFENLPQTLLQRVELFPEGMPVREAGRIFGQLLAGVSFIH